MCTFLGSPEMALTLRVVGKDEAGGRADLRSGRSSLALFYGLFEPQSGESLEWLQMKMCVLLLTDNRMARPSTGAGRLP